MTKQKKITRQEGFHRAWKHFVVDGALLSKNKAGTCSYRKGWKRNAKCRCVIGLLIPDELYSPEMEEHTFDELCQDFPEVMALFSRSWFLRREFSGRFPSTFGAQFQSRLHDAPEVSEIRRREYLLFAKDYGLKVPNG
jgi:hypothetical protein